MPLYEVVHSFPLSAIQKQRFATCVTEAHTRAFKTPSLFINVLFKYEDITKENYFVAGKVKRNCTNRIKALVRTSEARRKEHFDNLASEIENAWDQVLSDSVTCENSQQGQHNDTAYTQASRLIIVAFVPVISGRELGLTLPKAGEEKKWVEECREDFERRAEDGDETFRDMLAEIAQRDDLVDWRASNHRS